ncbi:polysaccharide pyruvyl transferase family protein [Streptomyces alkaliterrae]|uniref:polysaccharide pyruvyl transferase family protein n=1 Tax=Streptomyces alkaliterrae TaxID=2213162 RepID=UPI002B2193C5|nr:polysaccharide pyruvyl transferase family protein [Streptomyces alkaliterrae]
MPPDKTLLIGWFSFPDGEATAGDLLALRAVQDALTDAGLPHETAWSPGLAAGGRPALEEVPAEEFGRLVFLCGPAHGEQVAALHTRFAHCLRIAVGVSVVDPDADAVRGFHHVLARDAAGLPPEPDLSLAARPAGGPPPVAAVVLTHGPGEDGDSRHRRVADALADWLPGRDCAFADLDTGLGRDDWRLCRTADQCQALLTRFDLVVTDRLHGLVLALRAGVPVLAVDPVDGGAEVTAQARACGWPALVPVERLTGPELDRWWTWCLTSGPARARRARAALLGRRDDDQLDRLVALLR